MSETYFMLPRKKERELLINHIQAGNCAFIFGLPFIGKTALAHNIFEKLKTKDNIFVIYIDFKEFEGNTTDAVLESIILEVEKAKPGNNAHSSPGKRYKEYHLKKLLSKFKGKKVVILLDSAECIKKLSDWKIFLPIIRGLHEEFGVLFFLFSRIRPEGFAENDYGSPAINIFAANLIKLNLLPKHVVDTLPKHLASSGIEVEPVFLDFIWQHTGGHPLLIKTYLEIYEAEKRKQSLLDEHDFNSLEEKAEAKLQGFYKELFETLAPRHHQIIANDVLEGKISKHRDKYLRDLQELGILRLSNEGNRLFSIGARKYFQKDLHKRKTGGKDKSLLSSREQFIAALSLSQLLSVWISLLVPVVNDWFDRLPFSNWKWLIILISLILFITGCIVPIITALRRRKKINGSNTGGEGFNGFGGFGDRRQCEPPVIYQESEFYHNSWALVVGINNYEHERISNLRFAEDDAKTVASCLPALGFPEKNITLLSGEHNKVTREVILDVLETEFNPRMDKDDRFLFYFSGHGVSYEANKHKRGYILMQNSEIFGKWPTPQNPYLEKIPSKSLEMSLFLETVQSLPVKHKLLLIDSCFSGFMTHAKGVSEEAVSDINKKLAQWTCEPVTQVLTAGRSGQSSYEKESFQHGVFTWHLLEGLRGNADSRGDGVISFLDLAAYIRERVSREKSVEQDPQVGVFGEGQFIFLYRQ